MTDKEALSWIRQPGIMDLLPHDPHTREAIKQALKALKKESPCDLCRYNPPSSCDGKPCTMCPACGVE